eukprot:3483029-Alexandrium_andersonii.AAC.1
MHSIRVRPRPKTTSGRNVLAQGVESAGVGDPFQLMMMVGSGKAARPEVSGPPTPGGFQALGKSAF